MSSAVAIAADAVADVAGMINTIKKSSS